VYRKNLKTGSFQAPALVVHAGITVAVFLVGMRVAVEAESSAVALTADTVNDSPAAVAAESSTVVSADTVDAQPAAVAAESLFNDTVADIPKKMKPEKAPLMPVSKRKADTLKRSVRKRAGALRLPNGQNFLSVVSAIVSATGKKYSGLLAPITGLRTRLKKILFLACSFILILITIQFYQNYRERNRFMTTTRLSIMDKEVQRACRYIEEHYSDPALNLEVICSALVTGGAFLEALFMKELGLSIEDFIMQVRINRAKIALRKNPDMPVDTLARSVGYADQNDFLGRFEAVTGSGWKSYRDALAKGSDAAA
jgi:AraC-like DNA-binding protein